MKLIFVFCLFLTGITYSSLAQTEPDTLQVDSTYVISYENDFMARTFFLRRYTNFNFLNNKNDVSVQYSPNSGFAFGIGANYKWATINLSYAFDFLNPYQGRGETKAFDVQLHGYGQKIIIDLLGQFYAGFYLPTKTLRSTSGGFYTRPDIKVTAIGGTLQFVANNRRFSYRAAFMQNERQKKSAGTWLFGMEVYSGIVAADSSIVPRVLAKEEVGVREMRFLEIGPNVGYAYTWVYKGNFYVSGSASLSVNAGYNRYRDDTSLTSVVTISPNSLFRVSSGYAWNNWSVNAIYVATGLYVLGETDNHIIVNAGDMRLTLTYRFSPTRKMKKMLRPVDKAADEVESILDGGDKD
jgi:hypothetical protein